MQLFADRFVLTRSVQNEHDAIDLATGAPVTILTSSAGGASDQIRWSVRCDRFFRLHHRCIARLVDYGLVGQATRFEAWQCGERWRGSRRAASGTLARATIFLHAIASDSEICPRRHSHRPWTAGPDARRRDRPRERRNRIRAIDDDLASCGITTIHRRSIEAITEVLARFERTVAAAADDWRRRGCWCFGCDSTARTSRATEWLRTAGSASRPERRAHRGHRRPHAVPDRSPRRLPGVGVVARTAPRHAEAARASLDWRARAAEGAASSSRSDQRGSVGRCRHSAGRVGSIAESGRACSETVRRPSGEVRRTALGTGWSISGL